MITEEKLEHYARVVRDMDGLSTGAQEALIEEVRLLQGLLWEAWPYVTEQYEHNVPEGPNAAAKLHDRIYCALPRRGV